MAGRPGGSTPQRWAAGVATAIAYVIAARVGFGLAFVAEQITTVWAPTGLAMAALLVWGLRLWPAIWIAAFTVNAVSTAPLWTAVAIATGNTLEAVSAVWLLQRVGRADIRFDRLSDTAIFIGIAVTLSTAVSATIGVATLCTAGVQSWDRASLLWFDWWLGDALGALIVAPALLAIVRHTWTTRDRLTAAAFLLATTLMAELVFGRHFGLDDPPLEFLIFPTVIAAAAIAAPPATPLAVLGATAVAIWHTVRGDGPFAGADVHHSLILLQVFMGVLAGTAMLLNAAIAERRAAAELSRRREELLRLAQRAGGIATFEWDAARQLARCSAEFFGIFGLPEREGLMAGAEWDRFVHPDDRPRMAAYLSRVVKGLDAAEVDYRITTADGRQRWLTCAGQLQPTADGPRLIGTVVDITHRKTLEAELRRHAGEVDAARIAAEDGQRQLEAANRELRRRVLEQQTLLDVLPIGIGIANDPDCRHIQTNRAFAATLGLPVDANASRTAPLEERPTNFRVVTPDGTPVPDDQLPMQVAARENRAVRDVEFDVVHEDGRVVHLLEYAAPLVDEHGRPRGAVGAFVDVTARRAAETLLRQEVEVRAILARVGASLAGELRDDKLVQAITDAATSLTDAEFGAFFYNVTDERGDAFSLYTLSGASKDAFAGFPLPRATRIFAPTFRGEGIIRIADVTKDPRYGHNAPFHGMPPGHLPVRSYLAVPVAGRGSSVLGGLFFGHSQPGVFTERHELLAGGVAGWAAIALENARLYREAEDANRLKDEFLATLSHELRTPLNAVLGWTHVLRDERLPAATRQRALESVERNARAQATLVDDLLDVSRIMAGKLQIGADVVDLGTVIVNAVDTVRAGVVAKRLRLTMDVPAEPRLFVIGDADRLQQIVWNLVSNAIKFTPPEGAIDITLQANAARAEIVVRDTGQGIATSFQPYLFQRFRQMDASKTRVHGGLGLGLSIVRHLTEAHGGTVTAESEGEGRGATFRVMLPLRAHDADRAPARPLAGAAGDARVLAGVRVLVVDDDHDAREVIRYVLERGGADVVTAASADDALQSLRHTAFDAMVADIGMPGQDGLALIRVIRSAPDHAQHRHLPAIAVTAYAGAQASDDARRAGYQRHLGKPVDAAQLVAALLHVVRRTSDDAEAPLIPS